MHQQHCSCPVLAEPGVTGDELLVSQDLKASFIPEGSWGCVAAVCNFIWPSGLEGVEGKWEEQQSQTLGHQLKKRARRRMFGQNGLKYLLCWIKNTEILQIKSQWRRWVHADELFSYGYLISEETFSVGARMLFHFKVLGELFSKVQFWAQLPENQKESQNCLEISLQSPLL